MDALQMLPEMTLEEYEVLPENERVEVLDGIIYGMSSPTISHQRILIQLAAMLYNYITDKKRKCEVLTAPCDVKLSDDPLTIVQPDIVIVCDPDKLKDDKRCNGAPDFIIEIVSPSNAPHDYVRKLSYYEEHKVREYWIVDPNAKLITVYYLEEFTAPKTYPFASKIKVNIYDDLEIDFSQIAGLIGV